MAFRIKINGMNALWAFTGYEVRMDFNFTGGRVRHKTSPTGVVGKLGQLGNRTYRCGADLPLSMYRRFLCSLEKVCPFVAAVVEG